ncbi:phosphatase PAP2 family protein [Myxococcota bacterium]|nr:phosphatase PAP2 family protein [Myxococcota bacterium]MBU1382319.1 phosphatase PAP2 family protein [Myxococcota bacterium]MBU1498449.1 phosphatase PAP2 family protein [Myxococcota bacterium]
MTALLYLTLVFLPAQTTGSQEYIFHPLTDGIITGIGAGGSLVLELKKEDTTSDVCTWCRQNRFDEYFRRELKWKNINKARTLSNIFLGLSIGGSSSVMVLSTLTNYDIKQSLTRFAIFGEVIFTSVLLNSVAKRAFSRERPYVRDLTDIPQDTDYNVSFYSGHTSTAFTFVSAAVAFVFHDISPVLRWSLIGTGVMFASLTGYFRIAGDNHYFTDVLAGAAVGMALGILIPALHKKTSSKHVSFFVLPSQNGALTGLSGTF